MEQSTPNKSFNFARRNHAPDVQKSARPLTRPLGVTLNTIAREG